MHTLHENAQDRNTNRAVLRVRNWAFTLNNYMEAEIKSLSSLENCEYVFQEEKGEETKTPHLQGFLKFKQPQTLVALKKINARAHWEPARNVFALKQYCTKLETRNGKIYTNMKDALKIIEKQGSIAVIDKNEEYEFKNNFEEWRKKMIQTSLDEIMKEIEKKSEAEREKLFGHRCNPREF